MKIVEVNKESFRIRPLSQNDLTEIPGFVAECPPLSVHSAWFYFLFCNFQRNLCSVVEPIELRIGSPKLVGIILAMATDDDAMVWVQQIGVSERLRGQRTDDGSTLGELLWDALAEAALRQNRPRVVCSIEESNQRSLKLFEKFASRHGSTVEPVEGLVLPEIEVVWGVNLAQV